MALKTKLVPITEDGRDVNKLFLITEMPAVQAEKWGWRTFGACARAGVDIPDDAVERGLAGLLVVGLLSLARIHWHEAEPLLDEMFSRVQIIPNPLMIEVVRPLVESDIEEVATRLKLRKEVVELHLGFSLAVVFSGLSSMTATAKDSPDTPTSPPPLAA